MLHWSNAEILLAYSMTKKNSFCLALSMKAKIFFVGNDSELQNALISLFQNFASDRVRSQFLKMEWKKKSNINIFNYDLSMVHDLKIDSAL